MTRVSNLYHRFTEEHAAVRSGKAGANRVNPALSRGLVRSPLIVVSSELIYLLITGLESWAGLGWAAELGCRAGLGRAGLGWAAELGWAGLGCRARLRWAELQSWAGLR